MSKQKIRQQERRLPGDLYDYPIPQEIEDAWNKGWITSEFIIYLVKGGFFKKPASLKYHLSYKGGLYIHSNNVMNHLIRMTNDLGLVWQNERSPFLVGMFHDICKMDNYVDKFTCDDDDSEYEWNPNQVLKGHGDKSVMILSQFFQLTEEEVLCIRYHMGAYEQDDWEGFDKAIRKYPNVLYTHTADMYASKVLENLD